MTPAWILGTLAALMLVVAAVSASRILVAWRRDAFAADTDVAHLLMAIAMAGMLAPGLGTLPATAWEVVFGLLTVWFAGRVVRTAAASGIRALAGGHCAPHLVHSASMLYMFAAATVPAASTGVAAAMGGMPGGAGQAAMTLSLPTLAFVFALVLVGYGVWDIDQLSGRRYATAARVSLAGAGQAGVGPVAMPMLAAHADQVADDRPADRRMNAFLLSPAVTVGCRIAMGITMAFMLLIAL
jgi:predicted membrane protein